MQLLLNVNFSANAIRAKVIKEIDLKIKGLSLPRKYTIEKVLVTANEVTDDLTGSDYFNKIITLDEFYKALV